MDCGGPAIDDVFLERCPAHNCLRRSRAVSRKANGSAFSREPREKAYQTWFYVACGSSAAAPC